jgi:hypothetical protein
MAECDFEKELHGRICDILRAQRSGQSESKIKRVADALLPEIQEMIAVIVTAANAEDYALLDPNVQLGTVNLT